MRHWQHSTFLLLLALLCGGIHAQDNAPVDFYQQIKNYDLSTVITADSIYTEDRENSKDKVKRAEPLGFIGDNFQRFHIHFISIIQNPTNAHEYLAYGKTMVRGNVCSFQGKITVKESSVSKSKDITGYKEGTAVCEVVLYEDKKQSSTGVIKGRMTTNFIIDEKGKFRYDAVMFVADGFSNNQFIGMWTSYKTRISKKCNWGDYRIPESGDLDEGTGEFMVSEKYINNGWTTYAAENSGSTTSAGSWWK